MAWLIFMFAFLIVIFGIAFIVIGIGELNGSMVMFGVFCFIMGCLFWWAPTNHGEPKKTKHVTLQQDSWENMKFDSVALINYDIVDYSTWSYKGSNNKENVVILVNGQKITIDNEE